jgi:hypothetical protein
MSEVLELDVPSRIYGRGAPPESCVVAFPEPRLPLRSIIALKVQVEVERANRRRDVQLPLSVRYLTDDELLPGHGGTIGSARRREIDRDAEVARALKAFGDRRYFVVLDGHRLEDLDEVVTLTPATKLQFIRVLPLVGG